MMGEGDNTGGHETTDVEMTGRTLVVSDSCGVTFIVWNDPTKKLLKLGSFLIFIP